MNSLQQWAGVVALVILAAVGLVQLASAFDFSLGAEGTRFPNGVSASTNSPRANGELRGDDLKLDTSNTATSSAEVGCIQSHATSTATPVVYTFTPHVGTTTTQGGTSHFLVSARYGSCPI